MERLAHDDLGIGTPLLLIHAFPLDRRLWQRQREEMSKVARLVIPDLRGFGASTGHATVSSLSDYGRDLFSLLDHLEIERVVLCGVSMGGYITLDMLEDSPGRVIGMILCNTRATADSPEAREARLEGANRVLREGTNSVIEPLRRKMMSATTRWREPSLDDELAVMMQSQAPAGVANAMRAMAGRPDRTSALEAWNGPGLVIAGDPDPLIPEKESVAMARALRRGRRVVIEGTGHLSNYERPDPWNRAVRTFLAGI